MFYACACMGVLHANRTILLVGTTWTSEIVWLIMTGDYTSSKVQDERLYFLEGPNLMDFEKADADKGQRIFKV